MTVRWSSWYFLLLMGSHDDSNAASLATCRNRSPGGTDLRGVRLRACKGLPPLPTLERPELRRFLWRAVRGFERSAHFAWLFVVVILRTIFCIFRVLQNISLPRCTNATDICRTPFLLYIVNYVMRGGHAS